MGTDTATGKPKLPPLRMTQMRRAADFCQVLDHGNWPDPMAANLRCANMAHGWGIGGVAPYAMYAPHAKTANGLHLDGHVVNYSAGFLLGYAAKTVSNYASGIVRNPGYPFDIP